MLLRTQNLTLIYTDDRDQVVAVNKVNMELPEKGFFGILGPSGSGKTSLLYLLSGIRRATEGKIYFHNEELPNSTSQRNQLRRQEMGFVFQYHFLINYLSVEQNILIGANKKDKFDKNYVQELIERLNLKGLEKRPPYKISGGQRQRVAICRALANRPKIIFVDEPTASLDHNTGEKVIDLLEELAKEVCVLTVTHDHTIFKKTDGVFQMWDGQLKKER